MVRYEVADNLYTLIVGQIEQLLIVLPRAEVRIDIFEILGMIPMIICRLEDRREHDGVEAQILDVVKLLNHALQVSSAKDILTLWRHLPPSVESVNQQMIDSDVVKPVTHSCYFYSS